MGFAIVSLLILKTITYKKSNSQSSKEDAYGVDDVEKIEYLLDVKRMLCINLRRE